MEDMDDESLSPEGQDFDEVIVRNDSLAKSYKNAFMDDTTSDITLIVNGRRIPAHKTILSFRSDYFKALLFNGMQESKENEIQLRGQGDLQPEVFEPILYYIYTGEMDMASKEQDLIKAILSEASFFNMTELVNEIVTYLRRNHQDGIDSYEWRFQLLTFASLHQNDTLKEEIFQELEADPDTTVQMIEDICKLPFQVAEELLSRSTFWAKEKLICKAVEEWIYAAEGNDNNKDTINDSNDLARVVRLPNLTVKDLSGWVRDLKLFSSDDILEAINIKLNVGADRRKQYLRGIRGTRGFGICPDEVEDSEEDFPILSTSGDSVANVVDCWFHLNALTIADTIEVIGKKWSLSVHVFSRVGDSDYDNKYERDQGIPVADFSNYILMVTPVQIRFEACAVGQVWLTLAIDPECDNIQLTKEDVRINVIFDDWDDNNMFHDSKRNILLDSGLKDPSFMGVFVVAPLPNPGLDQHNPTAVLFNGSTDHNLTTCTGFVYHPILRHPCFNSAPPEFCLDASSFEKAKSNTIILTFGQPVVLDSFRFLLPIGESPLEFQPTFHFRILVSEDCQSWDRIADSTKRPCRGWQTAKFEKRPIVFILFEGTQSTLEKNGKSVFGLVHFEYPAP